MAKDVDINGFWLIKANPITKEGVFPYSGRQIDASGKFGLDPNKIYSVFRPASELTNEETINSFNGVPFLNDHEMIGDGCTDYDSRPAGGVLFNVNRGTDMSALFGDLKVYSEAMKDDIQAGKKELSLGYRCNYEPKRGVFNGQTYDFVQRGIVGNHIALVNKGRMGSDVRVYDSKSLVYDSIEEIKPMEEVKKEEKAEEKEQEKTVSQTVDEALKGKVSDEVLKRVMDALEEKPEEKEAEAKEEGKEEAKDADAEPEAKEEEKEEAKDADADEKAEEKAEEKEEAKAEDKAVSLDAAIPEAIKIIAARLALEKQVEPLIGTCDSALMTAEDYAAYACEKLKLGKVTGAIAAAKLEGFLAAKSHSRTFTMDSAPAGDGQGRIAKYLTEGK